LSPEELLRPARRAGALMIALLAVSIPVFNWQRYIA